MSGNDLRYWIGFNKVSGIGAVRLRTLLDQFGTIEAAWKASARDLHGAGLDERSVENLVQARGDLNLDAEIEKLARNRVRVLTWDDTGYPDIPATGGRGGGAGGAGTCHTGSGLCHFNVGGSPNAGYPDTTLETWEFNPATNAWTQLDSKPPGASPDGFVLGAGVGCMGRIFVGGDFRGFHDFFGLDATAPSGSQWIQLAPIPDPAGAMAPAMVCSDPEGAIYLIGGDPTGAWRTHNTTVYRYDMLADVWSGPLPFQLNVAVLGSCGLAMADGLRTFGGGLEWVAMDPPPHELLQAIACPGFLERTNRPAPGRRRRRAHRDRRPRHRT